MKAVVDTDNWRASLNLRFACRERETVLVDRRHYGPLRVQRPFYPESRQVCHVYLLHPPGGLVSGDRLNIDLSVDSGAWGLVTTPGAGKVYRSDGRRATHQVQQFEIADGGVLEWLPQENIIFDGAAADLLTRVNLRGAAQFIGWEITCLGRPASDERLSRCCLRQRFEVWRDGAPLWLERSRYTDNSAVFDAAWGLRGHPVTGSLVCTTQDATLVSAVREQVPVDGTARFSVTRMNDVLVCRYLGEHAQQAREMLSAAWGILRPAVLGAAAVAPRIWNT